MNYRDFEEFLESLNESGAKYLVVGAHAVAYHARPRATKDLDVYVDPGPENARRVLAAIRHFFGGGDPGFTEEDLTELDSFLQLGVAPIRIDLIKSLPGIASFEEAWQRRIDADYGTTPAHYLSLDDLIVAKEHAGREQDLADLRHLRRVKAER
jgi:predicted nucleotidyltransferase